MDQQPFQNNQQQYPNQQPFQNNQQQYPNQPQLPPSSFPGKGLCITGMVLGIVSLIFCWFYMINTVSLVTSIIGVICASMGRKKARMAGISSGIGTAGLVCSIIGLVFSAIFFFACTVCICTAETAAFW